MKKIIWTLALGLLVSYLIRPFFFAKPKEVVTFPEPVTSAPIVIGYSNWAGWWPWAIAEAEGLFAKNGANVELRWYDDYTKSINDLEKGVIDGNSQTLSDTISVAEAAVNGEEIILVNDFSAGNDKIIVDQGIERVSDLKDKEVALEVGVVDDFLLSLALEAEGLTRSDVRLIDLETGAAAAAFVAGKVDAVGAFPPFWLKALERKDSREIVSSKDYPGAISDLLVVSHELVKNRPDQLQALVNTWFDILDYMANNPERSDEIMARRAGVSPEEFTKFKDGTKMLSLKENLETFSEGDDMTYLSFAGAEIKDFLAKNKILNGSPDIPELINSDFVKKVST